MGLFTNRNDKLREAIRFNKADQVTELAPKLRLTRAKVLELSLLAVNSGASQSLKALLKPRGFDFGSNTDEDQAGARKLIAAATPSYYAVPLLTVLFEINKNTSYGSLAKKEFFNKDTPFEFIQDQLENNPELFGDCVNASLNSVERLSEILSLQCNTPNRLSALNNALVEIAGIGDIEAAKLLLEHQANPNASNALSLRRAAERGQRDMVDLLLPDVKANLCSVLAEQLQQSDCVPQTIITSIEQRAGHPAAPAVVAAQQPQKANDDNFAVENEYTLSETVALHDGTTLMTVFNFNAENAVTIYKTGNTASITPAVGFNAFKPEYIEARREILDKRNAEKTPVASQKVLKRLVN